MNLSRTKMFATVLVSALLAGADAVRADDGFLQPAVRQLSFQAKIPNLSPGDYCMTFYIYDVEVGGAPLHGAQIDVNLAAADHGVISVLIPLGNEVETIFGDGGRRFVALAINPEGQACPVTPVLELPGRVEIAATVYSMRTNFVGNKELTDHVELGDAQTNGTLDVYKSSSVALPPVITLDGDESRISTFDDAGNEVFTAGTGSDGAGIVKLRQDDGQLGLILDGQDAVSGGSGKVTVYQSGGHLGLVLDGHVFDQGGVIVGHTPAPAADKSFELQGSDDDGAARFTLYHDPVGPLAEQECVRINAKDGSDPDGDGDGGAEELMWNENNHLTVFIDSNDHNQAAMIALGPDSAAPFDPTVGILAHGYGVEKAGMIVLRDEYTAALPPFGKDKIRLEALDGSGGAAIRLFEYALDPNGNVIAHEIVRLLSNGTNGGDGGGLLGMRNDLGQETCTIDADQDDAARIDLRKANGDLQITLDADWEGTGLSRIATDVLEINGGSDLSEQFDVRATGGSPAPGMVVSIDPSQPGKLVVADQAYDCKVAGIISGAGDVRPGMLMGQDGSIADGAHPVALTGRVYCLVDASKGAIQPGDLLTSSGTPGHAMKVTDAARANGAILGKAMTSLSEGKGLVLVLVSLQ